MGEQSYGTSKQKVSARPPESVLPKRLAEVLAANREVVDAYVQDKSAFNKHRLNSMLCANGFTNGRDRENYIRAVATSRKWGKQ